MIISSIQRVTNYVYYPIHQKILRISSVNWKEKTMLTGLIISVCCAVTTFFTQTAFICSAFSMLSGVCGLGALYIRHYENLKKMKEQIETLQKENNTFRTHNQTLATENEKLQTEVTKLTVHTSHLMKTSQDLILSVKDLRVNLVALGPIVKGSQETEKKLSAFSTKMDKQQEVSQNLIELISKTMTDRPGQLALEQEILNQLQSLQNNDTTLQKTKELNLLQGQLSSIHDKLESALQKYTDVQNKMTETSNRLFYTQEQYCLEQNRLQEARQQYCLENDRLREVRQELFLTSQELSSTSNELKNAQTALTTLLSQHNLENQRRVNGIG